MFAVEANEANISKNVLDMAVKANKEPGTLPLPCMNMSRSKADIQSTFNTLY